MNAPYDLHALTGAYAVHALDDLERAQFEKHLAECPDCRAEVDSLREATALLADTTATEPPAALRDRVLADIATVRPLPPETPAITYVPVPATPEPGPAPDARTRHWFRRPGLLVAAAATVVAVAAGAVALQQPWQDETSQAPSLSAAQQVLQAPDAEKYVQQFPDGSKAVLTRSKSLNKAVLETSDMAPPPDGKVYELWLDHEGVGMVPAGLMPVDPDATVVLEGDPATAVGAGITVEPAGGSDKPTGDTVALIAFENA